MLTVTHMHSQTVMRGMAEEGSVSSESKAIQFTQERQQHHELARYKEIQKMAVNECIVPSTSYLGCMYHHPHQTFTFNFSSL